jgi:predicted molibdopterin-dependent oxidoreductase YjgC
MMRFGSTPCGKEGPPNSGSDVTFTLDGEPIRACEGDTIAAALYASGIRAWRRSHYGDERGLLCGIGYCFDCLVTVDGRPDIRACQTLVKEGMVVTTNLNRG